MGRCEPVQIARNQGCGKVAGRVGAERTGDLSGGFRGNARSRGTMVRFRRSGAEERSPRPVAPWERRFHRGYQVVCVAQGAVPQAGRLWRRGRCTLVGFGMCPASQSARGASLVPADSSACDLPVLSVPRIRFLPRRLAAPGGACVGGRCCFLSHGWGKRWFIAGSSDMV